MDKVVATLEFGAHFKISYLKKELELLKLKIDKSPEDRNISCFKNNNNQKTNISISKVNVSTNETSILDNLSARKSRNSQANELDTSLNKITQINRRKFLRKSLYTVESTSYENEKESQYKSNSFNNLNIKTKPNKISNNSKRKIYDVKLKVKNKNNSLNESLRLNSESQRENKIVDFLQAEKEEIKTKIIDDTDKRKLCFKKGLLSNHLVYNFNNQISINNNNNANKILKNTNKTTQNNIAKTESNLTKIKETKLKVNLLNNQIKIMKDKIITQKKILKVNN